MKQVPSDQYRLVADAFSNKAQEYESFGEGHPNLARMRAGVYRHVQSFLKPGDRLLELNAGTGIDAAHFASQGYRVHATDLAPGMLDFLRQKAAASGLEGRLSYQACSFTDLSGLIGTPYDYILSNFGGLNCIPDLSLAARQIPAALRPAGRVTWVIMPPVCLWDLALTLRGQFDRAFRRMRPGGTQANVAGEHIQVHYFTPSQALKTLGPDFRLLRLEGLSVLAPPADRKGFAFRYPHLYRTLVWLDERLACLPPFHGWGDFYILTAEFRPH